MRFGYPCCCYRRRCGCSVLCRSLLAVICCDEKEIETRREGNNERIQRSPRSESDMRSWQRNKVKATSKGMYKCFYTDRIPESECVARSVRCCFGFVSFLKLSSFPFPFGPLSNDNARPTYRIDAQLFMLLVPMFSPSCMHRRIHRARGRRDTQHKTPHRDSIAPSTTGYRSLEDSQYTILTFYSTA